MHHARVRQQTSLSLGSQIAWNGPRSRRGDLVRYGSMNGLTATKLKRFTFPHACSSNDESLKLPSRLSGNVTSASISTRSWSWKSTLDAALDSLGILGCGYCSHIASSGRHHWTTNLPKNVEPWQTLSWGYNLPSVFLVGTLAHRTSWIGYSVEMAPKHIHTTPRFPTNAVYQLEGSLKLLIPYD